MLETSEDEEAKKKEQEKADKKAKKGLSEKEIEAIIDIELCETNTFDLLFIPSQLVQNDSEEFTVIAAENKKYEELNIIPIFNVPYCPQFNGIESVFSMIKATYKKSLL